MSQGNLEKVIELSDELTRVNAENRRLKASKDSMQLTINKQKIDIAEMERHLRRVKK